MNATHALLRTKLYRPPLPADYVARPHLIEHLSARDDAPLVLVSAPAGFGKTTLLSDWLARSARRGAWVSLDERDNDLATFLLYVGAAVQTLFPDALRGTLALVNAPSPPPPAALAASLANDLDAVAEPFTLVLDDFHLITSPLVAELLALLLEHPPRALRLVLSARHDPPLALNRMRARGALVEVRAHDMRFSLEETASFLHGALGPTATESDAAALNQQSEGWVAGLRLGLASMRIFGAAQSNSPAPRMSSRLALDYLASEVLDRQPDAVQSFLLRASLLERVCASLCEAMFDEPTEQAQARLENLVRQNLFVVPLDDNREWFRFHPLLRELLLQRLATRVAADDVAAMRRRASAWFAARGLADEALHAALGAGDPELAAQLIEQQRVALVNQGQYRRLEQWLGALPREIEARHPALLLTQAWTAWNRFRMAEVIGLMDQAEPLVSALPQGRQADALRGEVEVYRCYQHYWAGQHDRAIVCGERALQAVPKEFWNARQNAYMYLVGAYQAGGQPDRSLEILNEGLTEAGSNSAFQIGVLTAACFRHWMAADLSSVVGAAQTMLVLGEQIEARRLLNVAHYFLGIVACRRNELAEAEAHLSAVVDQRYHAHLQTLSQAAYALALALQAQGRADRAREIVNAVPGWQAEFGNVFMLPTVRAVQAELALRQGDLAAAGQWAAGQTAPTEQPSEFGPLPWFYVQALTLPKILIAQGAPESLREAAQLLAPRREWAERTHNVQVLIQVLALEAVLQRLEGRRDAALASVERAIGLAQPGGIVTVFTELGAPMADLLRQAHRHSSARGYTEKILAAMMPASTATRPPTPSVLVEPLTTREFEVLSLLAQHLSNKQIAAKLVISPGTAKTHVHRIHVKLLARNRREVVEKAEALGLLSRMG